jgi:hypothetical protein
MMPVKRFSRVPEVVGRPVPPPGIECGCRPAMNPNERTLDHVGRLAPEPPPWSEGGVVRVVVVVPEHRVGIPSAGAE